jgi:hypothetical protein
MVMWIVKGNGRFRWWSIFTWLSIHRKWWFQLLQYAIFRKFIDIAWSALPLLFSAWNVTYLFKWRLVNLDVEPSVFLKQIPLQVLVVVTLRRRYTLVVIHELCHLLRIFSNLCAWLTNSLPFLFKVMIDAHWVWRMERDPKGRESTHGQEGGKANATSELY